MLRAEAHSLHFSMEEKAALDVNDLMLGCESTPKTHNLAIRLRLFFDIKDTEYYVMESLMVVMSLKELKVEEERLSEEFWLQLHSSSSKHVSPPRANEDAEGG